MLDTVLIDQEIESIDDPGSDGSDGSTGQDGSATTFPTARSGDVLFLNETFQNGDNWTLRNGSTATGGILTVIAGNSEPGGGGSITNTEDNWSAELYNLLSNRVFEARRFRLTFDARQTVGTGQLQIGLRYNEMATPNITGSFETYTYEFDGSLENNKGNDLVFGGRTAGDTWEIQNLVLEDIGNTSVNAESGLPGPVYLFTDFENGTYPYQQWGPNGSPEPEQNQWEIDNGTPRTTDHPDSPLKAGRNGTGRALWLGNYNSPNGTEYNRNQVGKDVAHPFGEWWCGFSFYIQNPTGNSRLFYQARLLAPGGSSTVNALSLREASNGTQLYWSLADDVTRVDQTSESLGTWNGAGTGTSSVSFDYNPRQWYDVVIHFKGAFGADYTGPDTQELGRNHFGYDPRSDGFIEIWVNGQKIVDQTGTTLYRYERRGGEIRLGITPVFGPYWSDALMPIPEGTNYDIFFDNIKMWNGPDGTYQDVDPSN
ncbi:heparin lyase I family protein [Muriicola sp. SD30]|uniref:heparin lyase I family protein n=1 Tax=Muriicola sp. SD30 TaxID=3240936 RepID=UPI00350F31E1